MGSNRERRGWMAGGYRMGQRAREGVGMAQREREVPGVGMKKRWMEGGRLSSGRGRREGV